MACQQHPQVISPCADDGVSVGQALGTRGDIAYDEAGSVALTVGQTSVSVEFGYTKESLEYVFEYCYILTGDAAPVDIRPVINSRSKRGFTCELTGMPITGNSKLFWRVVVPDPLHACQGLTNGPQYAQVLPAQQGIAALVQDQDFIEVVFPAAQPDALWEFESLVIHHPDVLDYIPMIFAWTCLAHEFTGFKLGLSGSPDNGAYRLHWRIRAL